MKTDEFNRDYEIDRKSRGVKATAKNAKPELLEISATADGEPFDPNRTYHFFDEQTQAVRQSIGLRRDHDFLCTFGLRVIAVAKLRNSRDYALADGQIFFQAEIERLNQRIAEYEGEKVNRI